MVTQVKEREIQASVLRRRVSVRPFGLKIHELVAAAAALIFFSLTVIFYLTSLQPKQNEVDSLQKQVDNLKRIEIEALRNSQKPTGPPILDQGKVAIESLSSFKSAHLKPLSQGRIALINDINAMAKKNSVTLTSGIDMKMDRAVVDEDDEKDGSKRKKQRKLFTRFSESRNAVHRCWRIQSTPPIY